MAINQTSKISERDPTDVVPSNSPLAPFVWASADRMHGEPCFRDTRVPVQTLFNFIKEGGGIEEFVDDYEGVTRDQVVGVLDLALRGLLTQIPTR